MKYVIGPAGRRKITRERKTEREGETDGERKREGKRREKEREGETGRRVGGRDVLPGGRHIMSLQGIIRLMI